MKRQILLLIFIVNFQIKSTSSQNTTELIKTESDLKHIEFINSLTTKDFEKSDLFNITSILYSHPKTDPKIDKYAPTFITNRNHDRFTNQTDYLKRANQIIDTSTKLIKSIQNKEKLFCVLLSYLSIKRGEIAQDHNTEAAYQFGLRRDSGVRVPYITILRREYKECSNEALSLFKPVLEKMIKITPPKKENDKLIEKGKVELLKSTTELTQKWHNHESVLDFEIFQKDHYQKWLTKERKTLAEYISKDLLNKASTEFLLTKEELLEFHNAEEKLKKIYPDYDEYDDMQNILCEMGIDKLLKLPRDYSPSLFVKVRLSIKTGEKTHPLTQYNIFFPISNAWLEGTAPNEDSNDLMEKVGVALLHQDQTLVQKTLDDAAKIFESIMKWNNEASFDLLQDQMALLTYLLVHNMRDIRGSAAENEWLILAIYEALGIQIKIDKSKLQDLEALSHPLLGDFAKIFKTLYSLKTDPKN